MFLSYAYHYFQIFPWQERLLEAGCRKNISEQSKSSFWPSSILGDTLRIVFQNLLLESTEEILDCSERVWRLLVQVLSNEMLLFFQNTF